MPVPRYTSYPTALAFEASVGSRDLRAAIGAIERGSAISLYLHIPYCEQICWYCGCNTGAANRRARLLRYLDALKKEIHALGKEIAGRAHVERIAFGGGSPNAIPASEFVQLMDSLRCSFQIVDCARISVELDPRSLTHRWANVLGAQGVTRVSMGIQSLAPAIQAKIGRVQPAELIEDAVTMLRTEGIGAINFDLMYGLPGQGCEDLERTIDIVVPMEPSRIALFGYAHHPAMFPRQRRIDRDLLPGSADRFLQASTGHDRLVERGYVPIGFDHFALPGDDLALAHRERRVRRNFQGFTEDRSHVLLGLGASAISQFPGLIVQNEKNPGHYRTRIEREASAAARGVIRTSDDQAVAKAIEELLCMSTISIPSEPDRALLRERLLAYENRGLVEWEGPRLSITESGRFYSQWIVSHLEGLGQIEPEDSRHLTVSHCAA